LLPFDGPVLDGRVSAEQMNTAAAAAAAALSLSLSLH